MCVVENFKQFLTNVASVSETTLPEEFPYCDSVILDLVKFACEWMQGQIQKDDKGAQACIGTSSHSLGEHHQNIYV